MFAIYRQLRLYSTKVPILQTRLTSLQRVDLEKAFDDDTYPSQENIRLLAEKLCLPDLRIRKWFSVRRALEKKSPNVSKEIFINRTVLSSEQLGHLEDAYQKSEYIRAADKSTKQLMNLTGLSCWQIQSWFKRRRMVAQHTLGEKTKPQEFSLEEREILEGIFCTTPYLEREKCDEIMGTFASQPTDTKIRRWFVDRRRQERLFPIFPHTEGLDSFVRGDHAGSEIHYLKPWETNIKGAAPGPVRIDVRK